MRKGGRRLQLCHDQPLPFPGAGSQALVAMTEKVLASNSSPVLKALWLKLVCKRPSLTDQQFCAWVNSYLLAMKIFVVDNECVVFRL